MQASVNDKLWASGKTYNMSKTDIVVSYSWMRVTWVCLLFTHDFLTSVSLSGEEIISGAQRVHDPDFLVKRAEACKIDVNSIATYLDSFK